MIIPEYRTPVSIEYNEFIKLLEEEKGYTVRDFACRWKAGPRILKEVSRKFGITRKGWSMSSVGRTPNEEAAWDAYLEHIDSVPYLDFWHWMLDGPFDDIRRGSIHELCIIWLKDKPSWYDVWEHSHGITGHDKCDYWESPAIAEMHDHPVWVETILQDIFEACKDHPAFDGDAIQFHVDW